MGRACRPEGAVSMGEASLPPEIDPLPLHLQVSTCSARVWQDGAWNAAVLDKIPMIG